ncbi:MAG: CRISPR-associated helicase Cas3' [Dermatophilus congolensis]|nr:CRISPR-associated helicase Cas3' [Dermatophilus congolensis]
MAGIEWSAMARSIWGKTAPLEHTWLPLVTHLEDAQAVAELLWDYWLAQSTIDRISGAVGGDEAAGRALLAWVVGVHDIAKAAPAFADKADRVGMGLLLDAMRREGLDCPPVPRSEYAHHGVMGHVSVRRWLIHRYGLRPGAADSIAVLVGGHHGIPPTSTDLGWVEARADPRRRSPGWGEAPWHAVRDEILDVMAKRCDLESVVQALPPAGLPLTVQVELSAAVTVADWLASDSDRFGYGRLDAPEERRARGLDAITLPPPWQPEVIDPSADPGDLLARRFPRLAGRRIRPFQQAMVRAALAADEAPIIVGEAPTGGGKTEGALLAAEILAERFGCGGTMIALPTMATSDGMFERVLDWLRALPGEDDVSVHLAHSKAGLNEAYTGLVRDSRARFAGVYDAVEDADEIRRGAPVVDTWLRGRKRGLLADHVVGTIDQVLMGALQTKHLALRHLALSSKVVVIDEVHAADDYMRSYLCRALDWLGAYGTPVVLLSATLPSEQRRELVEAYVRGRRGRAGRGREIAVPEAPSYPCLTVGAAEVRSVAIDQPLSTVNVEVATLPDDEVVAAILREAVDGGCVGVIRNTVGEAQQTYAALREALGDDVVLVHSRFIGPDRARLEGDIRSRLGPPSPTKQRPKRLVVVGTQVLEQSLDIDFDLMFSDIAPIDLVLQRAGRLHRHERSEGERPARMRTPRLVLTGVTLGTGGDASPAFASGCLAVYGRYRLLRSVAALGHHLDGAPIRTPHDVPGLVEAGYTEPAAPPDGWAEQWESARAAHETKIGEARRKAGVFQIDDPRKRSSMIDWLATPVSAESDELERIGKAQVRDTEDSLEVVLVRVGADGSAHVMPGGHAHADAVLPSRLGRADAPVARAAAACTVRLPRTLTHPGVIEKVITEIEGLRGFEGWGDDPWLGGQLVLLLDDDLTTRVIGHVITYDPRLGLLVTQAAGSRKEEL